MSGTAETPPEVSEIATIEKQMGDRGSDYWKSESAQERCRSLVAARDSGAAPPPPPPAAAQELAKIEKMMRTDRRAYDADPAMQQRMRDLLSGDAPTATDADAWRATPEQARQKMAPAVVQELEAAPGGFNVALRRAQDFSAVVLQNIGDAETAQNAAAGFQQLPAGVKAAIFREVAALAPGYVKPATDGDMAGFRLTDGGPETLESWGRHARRNTAQALEQFNRIVNGTPASDRPAFWHWWNHQTPRERQIITWALGSVT
jgi:hypothetical protein